MPNQKDRESGMRLLIIRKTLGLRQAEMASALDITEKLISNMERGRSGISRATMRKLKELYNIDLDYLINGDPAEQKTGAAPASQVVLSLEGIPEEKRIKALEAISTLVDLMK